MNSTVLRLSLNVNAVLEIYVAPHAQRVIRHGSLIEFVSQLLRPQPASDLVS